jgi:hypothetical protein
MSKLTIYYIFLSIFCQTLTVAYVHRRVIFPDSCQSDQCGVNGKMMQLTIVLRVLDENNECICPELSFSLLRNQMINKIDDICTENGVIVCYLFKKI